MSYSCTRLAQLGWCMDHCCKHVNVNILEQLRRALLYLFQSCACSSSSDLGIHLQISLKQTSSTSWHAHIRCCRMQCLFLQVACRIFCSEGTADGAFCCVYDVGLRCESPAAHTASNTTLLPHSNADVVNCTKCLKILTDEHLSANLSQ